MLILRIHLQGELRTPGSSHHSKIAVCLTQYIQHQDYPCHGLMIIHCTVIAPAIALMAFAQSYFALLFHAQQSYRSSW